MGRPKGSKGPYKWTPKTRGNLQWDAQLILEEWEIRRQSISRIVERCDKGDWRRIPPKKLPQPGNTKDFVASQLKQYPEYRGANEAWLKKLLSPRGAEQIVRRRPAGNRRDQFDEFNARALAHMLGQTETEE